MSKKEKKPSIWDNPNKKDGVVVGGRNIYKNKVGQTILYDKRTGNGYIIAPKNEGMLNFYNNRFAITIAIFMLSINFLGDLKVIAIVCAIFAGVSEYKYRKKFLPSLTRIANYKPQNKVTLVDALADTNNKPRCILLTVLYLSLGILMVINGYQIESSAWMLALDYAVLAFTIYMAITYIRAIAKMN